ncbi:MAG TPA: GNAT family N-acetyltransferase [Pirellulales bacterium]|jgi:ribosomal protein S18 acetylase RimI-like enzyme
MMHKFNTPFDPGLQAISMPPTIRPLVAADLPVADRILQAAFERTHSFTPMLRLNGAAQPGNQCVAVIDGQVVALVGAVDFGRFAYVALMGVDPAFHRRGIARQMMDHVLARLDAQGCPIVLLDATESGAGLYEQIGFVDDSFAYEYQGEATMPTAPPSGPIELMTAAMMAEVAAFDATRFGADRNAVLRILLAETPDRALVCRDEQGSIAGYAFARIVLGPWVARDPATAEQLFDAVLRINNSSAIHVLVPRSNEHAVELLERRGVPRLRRLRHMRRGGDAPPGDPSCLFGQVSFGLG